MDLTNTQLSMLINRKLAQNSQKTREQEYNPCAQEELGTNVLNSKQVDNELSVNTIGNNITDEKITEMYKDSEICGYSSTNTVKFSTTYKDFSLLEIMHIKQLIYDYWVENGQITKPDIPTPPETGKPEIQKSSFIEEFADTDTMFEFLHNKNPQITKETGITRAQLIELTRDDDWEDSNHDFFGSLNRIFDSLDKDDNDVLSAQEIENFIGAELGEDFNKYQKNINKYTQELQNKYEKMSAQEKLEFAIARAEEYLIAAGMQEQLNALNRLKAMSDKFNSIHVGQIAIADLNAGNESGYITLGAYTYMMYPNNIIASDEDFTDAEGQHDLGITLDISLLDEPWYYLVNTIVHELTHAAGALLFAADSAGAGINKNYTIKKMSGAGINVNYAIEQMLKAGAIDENEATWYKNYIETNDEIDTSVSEWKKFIEQLKGIWGEYTAYQADADYYDSIGEDEYYTGYNRPTTAVNGSEEKDVIAQHIQDAYNGEYVPDWDWWTYKSGYYA